MLPGANQPQVKQQPAGSTADDSDIGTDILPPPPSPVTGTISTSAASLLSSQAITASGGAITVNKPGDPLNGMQITVPAGAYADGRTFKVSSSPITGSTFKGFTPVSPLISVDNGGGYSSQLMTVKIPVAVPSGSFATGFIYDRSRGTLEALPLVARDNGSITIATRHFSDIVVESARLAEDLADNIKPAMKSCRTTGHSLTRAPGLNSVCAMV
jgi:hypothetical protein